MQNTKLDINFDVIAPPVEVVDFQRVPCNRPVCPSQISLQQEGAKYSLRTEIASHAGAHRIDPHHRHLFSNLVVLFFFFFFLNHQFIGISSDSILLNLFFNWRGSSGDRLCTLAQVDYH